VYKRLNCARLEFSGGLFEYDSKPAVTCKRKAAIRLSVKLYPVDSTEPVVTAGQKGTKQ